MNNYQQNAFVMKTVSAIQQHDYQGQLVKPATTYTLRGQDIEVIEIQFEEREYQRLASLKVV